MAKISAYGEREIARWRLEGERTVSGWARSPQTLVLTVKRDGKPGRLLKKFDTSTGGYAVVETKCTRERASEYAQQRGFAPTAVRR